MGWNSTGHPKAAHEYARKGPESQMVKMITFFQNPAQVDTGGSESRENLFFRRFSTLLFIYVTGCGEKRRSPIRTRQSLREAMRRREPGWRGPPPKGRSKATIWTPSFKDFHGVRDDSRTEVTNDSGQFPPISSLTLYSETGMKHVRRVKVFLERRHGKP